ncbi:peptide/nickel transport system permease protein [Bowdeniella nasicola]|uniref:Peptide/nickel transport system permease protein n=1 Tax=Bowdeniella nasicola TaxID=208480 RepID=A0A1H3VIV3_9ACTO|nr:ABC transporter permease [Bowdeniella nasicola]SDZ74088.1 peptide/nickel transport system permease protein [Bowdeniella nasicola]
MTYYLIRRILNYILLLFIAITLAYIMASTFLRPEELFANRQPPMPPDQLRAYLEGYNISSQTPVMERYWTWLTNVVMHWDWGYSPQGDSVNGEMGRRAWVSLRLVTIGAFVGMVGGVAIGAWTATKQYSFADRTISIISLILISTPSIVLAITLQIMAVNFNRATGTEFFEFIGEYGQHGDYFGAAFFDRLQHLLLPTISMSAMGLASYSRYQRNLMLDTLGADYVRTARAKGLIKRKAVTRHALRTSLIPMGTYFAFAVTGLMLGAAITESVFGWHGMGIYGVETIQKMDINGTVAVVAFSGACTLAGAFLSDVLVAVIDPRVRVS